MHHLSQLFYFFGTYSFTLVKLYLSVNTNVKIQNSESKNNEKLSEIRFFDNNSISVAASAKNSPRADTNLVFPILSRAKSAP